MIIMTISIPDGYATERCIDQKLFEFSMLE